MCVVEIAGVSGLWVWQRTQALGSVFPGGWRWGVGVLNVGVRIGQDAGNCKTESYLVDLLPLFV